MSEQKIDRTFMKAMDQINNLQKVFRKGGLLEKAIMELGGDVSTLLEVNNGFNELYDDMNRAHYDAVRATEESVNENLNEGVLDSDDDDGFMARSQLYFMAKDAISLHGMIDDRDDLEPWVQSKIAQSAQAMDAVRRYTEYNAMGNAPEQSNMEMPQETMYEDPSKPKFPIKIKLAGDSIWDEGGNPDVVTISDYAFDKDEEGDINITVEHDGPWTVYTDTGFEKAVSNMIGHDVEFSEQGLQRDGKAHLESADTMKEGKYKNDAQRKAVHAAKNEAYSPGDENAEDMVSNCCGAPIADVYDGHGRCSDCKEMAKAVNEGTQGCADCEWIRDETDGDITTCDECAAEKRQKTNEAEKRWKQTSMSAADAIEKYGKSNVKVKKGGLRNGDDMVEVLVEATQFNDTRDGNLKEIAKDMFEYAKKAAYKKVK